MIKHLKTLFGVFGVVALIASTPVMAQSTAARTVTGYLTTTGCPNGSTVCFKTAYSYRHISTATNTQVFTGPGELYRFVLNTKAGGAATATIYDNTSCATTVVGVVDLNANDPISLEYNSKMSAGLCITTTAATDITISYRTN